MTDYDPPPLKELRVPLRSWESERDRIVVWIRPTRHGHDAWDVFADPEGARPLGEVSKYTGTLDRPIRRGARIVHRGKERALWSYRAARTEGDPHPRGVFGNYSRADCIRSLVANDRWARGR